MNATQQLIAKSQELLGALSQCDEDGDHASGIALAQQLEELGSRLAFAQAERAELLDACR